MPYYRVDFEDTTIKRQVSFNVWASDNNEAILLAKRSMGYCDRSNKIKCLAVEREAYVDLNNIPIQKNK